MKKKKKAARETTDGEKVRKLLKMLKAFRKQSSSIYGNKNLQFFVNQGQNLAQGRSNQAPEVVLVYWI